MQEGRFITAGSASQPVGRRVGSRADGGKRSPRLRAPAGSASIAGISRRRLRPRRDGDRPGFRRAPKLLAAHGLASRWTTSICGSCNEAFACQVIYCRDRLGIPNDRLNVDGGAISIGHPYGMSGARMVGHALIEGKRRGAPNSSSARCASAVEWVLRGCSKWRRKRKRRTITPWGARILCTGFHARGRSRRVLRRWRRCRRVC